MMQDDDNRILMSDSIRGMVPELEEDQTRLLEDAFVIGSLEVQRNDVIDVITGKVVGISHETEVTKIDIRLSNREAYSLFKELNFANLTCVNLYLHLAELETKLVGPFKMTSPKLMDFDHQHKMCTLGIDLIKI